MHFSTVCFNKCLAFFNFGEGTVPHLFTKHMATATPSVSLFLDLLLCMGNIVYVGGEGDYGSFRIRKAPLVKEFKKGVHTSVHAIYDLTCGM